MPDIAPAAGAARRHRRPAGACADTRIAFDGGALAQLTQPASEVRLEAQHGEVKPVAAAGSAAEASTQRAGRQTRIGAARERRRIETRHAQALSAMAGEDIA